MHSVFDGILSEMQLKTNSQEKIMDSNQIIQIIHNLNQKLKPIFESKLENEQLDEIEKFKLESNEILQEIELVHKTLKSYKSQLCLESLQKNETIWMDDNFEYHQTSDESVLHHSPNSSDPLDSSIDLSTDDEIRFEITDASKIDDDIIQELYNIEIETYRSLRYSFRQAGIQMKPFPRQNSAEIVKKLQIPLDRNFSILSFDEYCVISEFSTRIFQLVDQICFPEYEDPSRSLTLISVLSDVAQFRFVTGVSDFSELCTNMESDTFIPHLASLFTELAIIATVLCFVNERIVLQSKASSNLVEVSLNISLFCDQSIMSVIENRLISQLKDTLLPSSFIFPNSHFIPIDEMAEILKSRLSDALKLIESDVKLRSSLPQWYFMTLIQKLTDHCYDCIIKSILEMPDITVDWCDILAKNCQMFLDSSRNLTTIISSETYFSGKITKSEEKLSSLLYVMNAGLQDISYVWADLESPLRRTFTCNELLGLINAIFQDTDMRKQVLSEIMGNSEK